MSEVVIRVEVTYAHIAAGIRCDCKLCPLAKAIADAVGRDPTVMHDAVGLWRDGECHVVLLPLHARRFVAAFDGREKVQPFAFDLPIPAALAAEASVTP